MKTSTHTDICMKEVCGKAVGQEGISEGDKYKISLKSFVNFTICMPAYICAHKHTHNTCTMQECLTHCLHFVVAAVISFGSRLLFSAAALKVQHGQNISGTK